MVRAGGRGLVCRSRGRWAGAGVRVPWPVGVGRETGAGGPAAGGGGVTGLQKHRNEGVSRVDDAGWARSD